jgi:hypothetical protein
MIKSGGSFFHGGYRCVIGAVLSIRGRQYIATASHIFHRAGTCVEVEGMKGMVRRFIEDYDVALIEVPSTVTAEVTEIGSAAIMDDALMVNENHSIPCRVTRAGVSLLSLQFPCSDMPQPGDSGSPIMHEGKVVGLLSSVMFGNCTGTAVSSDVLRSLNF